MGLVLVVDTEKRPLAPCHPARARKLLTGGKAAVWRRYPFVIILKRAVPDATPEPLRVKIDPGSKTTGLAMVNKTTGQVVWAAELIHRGQQVRDALLARRTIRQSRRQRHTRHRPARFDNRHRQEGWLPPSLDSRINNILTWEHRLRRYAPIGAISQELVRFDIQILETPDISGAEYQQGELAGYEVREHLLEKWERRCAYCGAMGVPLQIDHIVPKVHGGSNRVSNLTLACEPCNTAKGAQTAAEFGHPEVQAQARRPLKEAAAINASRWALYHRLQATRLPVEVGTGGRTKWNRTVRELPKSHWLDAACVGASTLKRLLVAGVTCSPSLKGRGFSRPAGEGYRRNGRQPYRNCFTRWTCPARTVQCKGCRVRRASNYHQNLAPVHSPIACQKRHYWEDIGSPSGYPAFIPSPKGAGHSAGFLVEPLQITATGRHSRQMCRPNAFGFCEKVPKAISVVAGLRTGDIVRAVVPLPSIKAGTYVGRLAVRATGNCNIKTRAGLVQGVHVRFCRSLHRGDGYRYEKGEATLLPHA